MTKLTREYIEEALRDVREDFERRGNAAGLEILDSYEEGWAEYGRLTDRQLAWLERQMNGSWRRTANPNDSGADVKPRNSLDEIEPAAQQISGAAIRRRLRQQGKAVVDLAQLAEVEAAVDELKRIIQLLR
jgi:hypothetical protein